MIEVKRRPGLGVGGDECQAAEGGEFGSQTVQELSSAFSGLCAAQLSLLALPFLDCLVNPVHSYQLES